MTTDRSGSFIDEGLELSQRLAESMFSGPDLDSTAAEVITGSGNRVAQSVENLLDMLENTINQVCGFSITQTAY